jgi:hypothetical protein
VHFRPVRNDQLFESAKAAGRLAYRILFGEGVVRAQLWIEYEVHGSARERHGAQQRPAVRVGAGHLKMDTRGRPISGDCRNGGARCGWRRLDRRWHHRGTGSPAHRGQGRGRGARTGRGTRCGHFFSGRGCSRGLPSGARAPSSRRSTPSPAGPLPGGGARGISGFTLERGLLGQSVPGFGTLRVQTSCDLLRARRRKCGRCWQLLLRREAAGTPGLMVEGASGSGKSSFLRAGSLAGAGRPEV